jgi:hypothetical protein
LGVVSSAASAALTGCVSDDVGDGALRIIRNQALDASAGCVVPSTLSTAGRFGGTIEVISPVDYVLTPVIQNFATSQSSKFTAQRTAFLEGAKIDITFAKADLFSAAELTQLTDDALIKFSTPFSAAVTPDNGTAGLGFSVVPAELLRRIQPKLAAAGNSTVLNVRVKVFGSMGGGDVESDAFYYPVTVCDSSKGVPCVIASTFVCGAPDITVRKGNACNPFQDGPVDCCTSTAGTLMCPGTSGTALR